MHRRRIDRCPDRRHRPRPRAGSTRPSTARRTAHARCTQRPRRQHDHRRGVGRPRSAEAVRRRARPACISVDHPRFLSFVPAAPTEGSDPVRPRRRCVERTPDRGSKGGAIFAENQALRWIADLAGLPATAGGVFVSGGTAGNLGALIAARWAWRREPPERSIGPVDCSSRRRAHIRRWLRRRARWMPTWCSCRPTIAGA